MALLCRLVGDEVNLSGLQTEEVDLTEEDTMEALLHQHQHSK